MTPPIFSSPPVADYTAPLRPVLLSSTTPSSSSSSSSYLTALEAASSSSSSRGAANAASSSSAASTTSSMYFSAENLDSEEEEEEGGGDNNNSSSNSTNSESEGVDPETVKTARDRDRDGDTPTMAKFRQELLHELSQQGSTEETSTTSPEHTATEDKEEEEGGGGGGAGAASQDEQKLRRSTDGDEFFADAFPGTVDINYVARYGSIILKKNVAIVKLFLLVLHFFSLQLICLEVHKTSAICTVVNSYPLSLLYRRIDQTVTEINGDYYHLFIFIHSNQTWSAATAWTPWRR